MPAFQNMIVVIATVLYTSASTAQDDPAAALQAVPEVAEPETAAAEKAASESATPETAIAEPGAGAEILDTIPVAAEDDGKLPQVDEPRARSRLIEEVVVTAQKREENLQDVPISVQAFSAELLDARGIRDQRDLMLVTPALDIGTQVSFTTIYMRGVGTDAYLTADPSVATYVDGIYFPFSQGLAQDFGVVERVEVLKGPQGTLFGRNATGGALSIITKDPEVGVFSGGGQLTFANYPDFHSKANINIPIGETIAVSLSGIYATTKSYLKGTADGRPLDDDREGGVRIKARWVPNENMDATLSYFYLDSAKPSTKFATNQYGTDLTVLLGQGRYPNRPYEGSVDARTDDALKNEVLYGNVKFFTPWFDIKILGSDQYINTQGRFDFDGTDFPLVSFAPKKNFADIQTGELQFISNDWSPDWLKWIGGVYYFKGLSGFDPIAGELNVAEPINNLLGNILTPVTNLLGYQPDDIGLEFYATVATKSESAFTQMTFSFTDWMALTLGLRYQKETREIDQARTYVTNPTPVPVLLLNSGPLLPPRDQQGKRVDPRTVTDNYSPKVSLEFRPITDTLAYLSYQEATKSATYNVTLVTSGPTFAYPETMHAWELGTKTKLFGGLLSVNAAAFAYDIDNMQVQFLSLLSGGVVNFENAQQAKIRGMDFDFVAVLFPDLVDDLVLLGGAAWLKKAEYSEFRHAKGFNGNLGVPTSDNDYSGNRVVRTPKYTGNLSLSKTRHVPGGPFEATVDYYYNDGFYYETSNNPRSVQDSYFSLGARITYLYESWNLRATLFGKNLTDELYTQGMFVTDFGLEPTTAPPRTYGLMLAWEF